MDNSISPYVPPHSNSKVRQRRAPISFVVPAVVLCGLNLALGAIDCPSEMCEFSKWGSYCGQYIVLVTWFALGVGTPLNRLATASWIGVLWMSSSWLGFAIAEPDRVLAYSHEFSQMFNVVPLAFVISSLPLFLLRRHFGFTHSAKEDSDLGGNETSSLVVLGVILVLVCIAYLTDRWLLSDVGLSFMIAVVLGVVATVAAPLLSIAWLGPQPKFSVLVPVFIVLPLLGALFAGFFGMPGPGAAGTVFATLESMLAAMTALGPIVATYWYWRLTGIRMNRQQTT